MTTHDKRPRVGIISIHPAPYRDPTFTAVQQRGTVDVQILTMFDRDAGHPYWNLERPPYPNIFLGKSVRIREHMYWHPHILSALRRGKFDAVVVPGYVHITCQLATLFCLVTRTPLIYSADSVLFTVPRRLNGIWRDRVSRFILRHAAAVWVPGKASRIWATAYGINPKRIFEGSYNLDPHAISDRLREHDIRSLLRSDFGFDSETFVFLMVAAMTPNRRHQALLRAFAQVTASAPNTHLILIGSGTERTTIDSVCAETGGYNVTIIDSVPFGDLPRWYAACDAYVHSGDEPYSTAVAYAAIAGRPVIVSSHVGAVLDFVVDQETGCVVTDSSPGGFARAMFELAQTPGRARKMGEQIHEVAMRRSTQWAAEQLEQAVITAVRGVTEA